MLSPFLKRGPLLLALAFSFSTLAAATELRVEIGTRSPSDWRPVADAAVRAYASRIAALTDRSRATWERAGLTRGSTFLPMRVVLTRGGRPLPMTFGERGRDPDDIVPTFDTGGDRAFPPSYRSLLERTFVAARPAMNGLFGRPAVPGTVRVRNYDADIQARLAVAGGYFVPNGPDGPEVRIPVYNNPVAASINYVHTLLLAYQGPKPYPFDAYSEGLVRAVTMGVARTPGSLPDNPDADQVEGVLGGLYDVGPVYDWANQPGLGARRFIAPNLLDSPLPPGGSTGGPYLLRYQMAGTAWAKLLAEVPGFAAELNRRYYAAPDLYQSVTELEALGQIALDAVRGSAGSTVEGLPFAPWAARQAILDPAGGGATRAIVQVVPLPPTPGSSDFGVFNIELNAVRVAANGNETLLGGASFPIYWRPDFTRTILTAQDDRIDVAGGYGSVVPNFTADNFNGQPYRMTVDVPFGSRVTRVNLPAGAIASGADPAERTFAGTLIGLPRLAQGEYVIAVTWNGGQQGGIPVTNFAFGARLTDASFLRPGPLTVQVFRRDGGGTVEVISRRVNKTNGPVYVDLTPASAETAYDLALPGRLALLGLPLDPYRPNPVDALRSDPLSLLLGAWNPVSARYDLFPDEGQVRGGRGFWLRAASNGNVSIPGRSVPQTPVSVALEPGWNMVTVPFAATAVRTDVLVTVGAEALTTFADAVGTGRIGSVMFGWTGDPNNPDSGSLVETLEFRPGQAVFVRANRPEGAALVFFPRTGNRPAGRDREPRPRVQWEGLVSLVRGRTTLGSVRIGQSPDSRALSRSALTLDVAPSPSGVRVWSSGPSPLYRDVRPVAPVETFTVVMDSLIPGEWYGLKLRPIAGRRDLAVWTGTRWRRLSDRVGHTFQATARRMTFQIQARGSQ